MERHAFRRSSGGAAASAACAAAEGTSEAAARDTTRERIVRAATPLFAEKGLSGVTVREICRAARVNVALVNYHFRSKEGLYRECVERVYAETHGAEMAALVDGVRDARSWRAAVAKWVETFADALHATDGLAAFAAGLYRLETVRPSAMQSYLDARFARPARAHLLRLLEMAASSRREAQLWAASVWAQLSAPALFAPVWRASCRPAGVGEKEWAKAFAGFVRDRILKELKFRRADGNMV